MTRFLRENIMADRTMIQLVCIILVVAYTNCDLIQFKPGVVYSYDYKSSTTLHGVGHIDTTAEILIELVNAEEIGQHCLMTVEDVSYKLSNEGTKGALGTYSKGDFSHWFSFLMTKHGEILSVFYGEEDKPEVIVLKKLLIGALSVKLHCTETTLAKGVPWSYRVNETGHEGYHEATYSVHNEGTGFLFKKKRHGHVVENANASHVKSILYDHSLEIPRIIDVQEYFIPPNNRGKRKQSAAKVTQSEGLLLEETDIPLMKGSSWSTLTYTGQEFSDRLNTIQMPDNVIKGDLRIDEIPVPKIPLSENERFIARNITCMKTNPSPKSPERTGCFQNIIQMIGRLSKDDVEHFAVAYIKPNKTNLNNSEVQDREIAIDALGAVATEITQELLTNMILLSNRPNAVLIMQTLIHFVELDRSPPDVAVEAITRLAFYPELTFTDRKLMDLVHNRAILILGSVAKTLKASELAKDRQKADEILKAVEDSLGVHDHWHHRQVRSTLSQQDYNDYIEEKAALIHSLGNAISPSSYEHLLSYVNNSDSHPMLRRSGVHAIGKYSHQQAARTLLDSAMLDVDETVRYVAATEYLRHSHAKDMHHIIDEYGNINVTLYSEERPVSRQRRGLFDGFQVELKTPSFEWIKEIGTSDIGGSMGLILKNSFNLDIKPLEGSMKIDIFDHAYAKGHVGYIDFEFTMLDAKVCFKGESSYSLNILQEFDFDKIKTMVTQFDKVVANVIGAIRDAISKFVELLSPDSISFSKIFDNFINAVKDLPTFVKSLTSIVHDIMRRIGKYIGLPDFFYHLQNVIFRISGLFNAVRRDVMELYNSINDAITVTLPWAAEQVLEAIDYASSAVEILFESPVSAIKDISRFIFQIKNAVSGILHAKRRIEVACFFDEGSPPYWFNLKDELTDIWEEIKSLKNSFKNMGNWSVDGDKIKEFTGIPQSAVKAYIVADILGLFDLLSGPIERLKEIAEPFLRTYQTVAKAIENIKDGYERVKSGYETAKTFLNKIFGSRGAKKFPRKIAITNCGKGFYPSRQGNLPRGIDLEIKTGSTLVSPFTGNVTRSGKYQITIDVQDELKDTEVIINHVNLDNKNQNRMVYKGTRLGRVVAASSDCTPNAIHLSMRRKGTTYYFDPTKYIEKRKILTPPWKQYCDEYLLIFKGATIAGPASITKGAKQLKESYKRTKKPKTKSLSISGRSRREADANIGGNLIEKGKGLLSKLGLPEIDDRGLLFDLNIKDISLKVAFEYLEAAEQDSTTMYLNSTIQELKELLEWRDFRRPETLTDDEIRITSSARGKKSRSEARPALIKQFRQPEERCREELWPQMPKDTFCNFDLDCKGVQCDLELDFFYFPVHVPVTVRLDSCQMKLLIELGTYETYVDVIDLSFDGPIEDNDVFQEGIDVDVFGIELFQSVHIKYNLSARVSENDFGFEIPTELDLQLGICSKKTGSCMPYVTVFEGLLLETELCDSDDEDEEKEKETDKEIEEMSLQEFEEQLSIVNIDQARITSLINDILFVVRAKTIEEITTKLLDDFENEFSNFDIKLSGGMEVLSQNVKFFEKSKWFTIGPVPCQLGFGASGSYGVRVTAEAAILSMRANITVRPEAGAAAYGSFAIGIPFFYAEIELKGYILSTAFPTQAQIKFNGFPLDLETRMDLVMIPLKLVLSGRCVAEVKIPFIGSIKKVIINIKIWSYTTRQIERNIFNKGDLEPDNTPPEFTPITVPKPNLNRPKRGVGAVSDCVVEQVPFRDEVEPAFALSVSAADDKSEVNLTYCVGTFKSGCDVLDDQEMGGQSVVIAQILPDGIPLHFTVKAMNSAKGSAMATCFLQTYDITLPEARIVPEFYSTSRPDILRLSAVAYDDSPIVEQKLGIGFGSGIYGDQLIPWTDVTPYMVHSQSHTADSSPLDSFTSRRPGRLALTPYETAAYKTPSGCAQQCLPQSECISFNYDYGSSGKCELLNRIESNYAKLHDSGEFYYFEKIGFGGATHFTYDSLQLRHSDVYYVNMHVTNILGYENVITSLPIVVDFEPPSPGDIQNALYEELSHQKCATFLPEQWKYRCVSETSFPNHRLIIDGPDSSTVFNGHEPLVDLLYTRANTYISANWDGFHDKETGIFGYTLAVGTSPCLEDIVPHYDPHFHIANEMEWTHRGTTSNFGYPVLPDGRYYMTVRAINKVEFGGPMATTVCHSTPYTIDTTQPLVNEVVFLIYDEDTCVVSAHYNVSDDLSYVREIEMGLGKSRRDIYIMDWKQDSNITHVAKQHCVPDGLPTWIKIKAINNVDLSTVGHPPSPFIVDTSPPTAGQVFDGLVHDHDIDYQNRFDEICVSWHGFYDEHSGLEKYIWQVGTSPGDNDTIMYVEVEPFRHSVCNHSVILTHNTTYYSTITAQNAGHKKLTTSVTTDGVLYDETAPVEGWIYDGLDPTQDMTYSPKASSVSANWDDYYDPESDIKNYMVTVWRRHAIQGNSTPPFQIIHDAESIQSSEDSINWHHFHLLHMDYVFLELQTTNRALTSINTETDGYLVDLTVPIFKFLGDGPTIGHDIQYTSSATELSANWNFEDPESDIEVYKISVYETYGGTTLKIYPSIGDNEEVDPSLSVWTSSEDLSLTNGAHYSVRVSAVNGAGLTNVQNSDGVFVDTTSPIMRQVSIGVLSEDEEEEIIDGFVLQTDTEGIKAYWRATDFESGVIDYLVAIGTDSGNTDVLDFTSMGPTQGAYIEGLQLQRYSIEDSGPVYFLTVKAINGAGSESSTMTSSALKVVNDDKTGLVYDGPEDRVTGGPMDGYVDTDYQRETGTVTAQFSGFESEMHGIAHYEWAVGTRPRLDDIQPYISNGILVDRSESGPGDGLIGSGIAQSLLPLDPRVTYFTTVRALTGAGNALDSTSDGFTVDTSPPFIKVDNYDILQGNQTVGYQVENKFGTYQKYSDSIVDSWHVTEDESEVYFTGFCYGSYPGASDIYSCTDTEGRENTPNAMVKPNTKNLPNVVTVSSVNKVGLWSRASSVGVTVDTTPPIQGDVICPSHIRITDDLKCSWSGFYDAESGIAYYLFTVGLAEEDNSIYPFTVVVPPEHDYTANGPFEHQTYYVTITAVNNVGDSTNSFSQPIYVDETPPVGGRVVELTGVDEQSFQFGDSDVDQRLHCMTFEDCISEAAVCQKSLDRILVAWEPFQDTESPIIRYQLAVGTSPGGAQLKMFYDVDTSNGLIALITGINLYDVRQAFVSVRGFNAAGLHTTVVSNGIFISRVSAGLPPLNGSYVWDGNGEDDIDYQDTNEVLYGQWCFDGDPCPKLKYEWSIDHINGTVVQPVVETSDGFGMNDGFNMKNGETYYLVVRATNLLGYASSLRSNGITIQLEPLAPKDVRDGAVYGFDLNYQSSITTLSANWDAFGLHSIEAIGQSGGQVIDHYEIAAGTDKRYPNTRDDIHRFVDVGLNTSHTFTDLQLIPETWTYYVTVRAYAVSTAMVEVTSNGIRVGFGGELLSQGQINIQRYTPSTTSLTVSWSNFRFVLPVLFYNFGIGRNTSILHSLSCKNLQTPVLSEYHNDKDLGLQHLFQEWTEVGKDTLVEQTGLNLEDKQTYTAVVMATDESGHCSLVSSDFTVDVTPPNAGNLKIGAFEDEEILYTSRADMLFLSWSDFNDAESGIGSYSIALYDGVTCGSEVNQIVVQDFTDITPNDTAYTFVDLDLKPQRPYFVRFRATNNAGLATTVVSKPIILDVDQPSAGVVKDGIDFQTDKEYQSSTSTIEGVFLHLPNPSGDACPSRHISMATDNVDDWSMIRTRGVWGVDDRDTVVFRQEQLSFNENDDSLSVTMIRDVKDDRMYSGALYHSKPDIREGGKYQVDVLAASGDMEAVTSVVFWDGPDGVVGDFHVPFDDIDWEDDVREFDACGLCCLANDTYIDDESSCPCNCTAYLDSLTTTFTTTSSTTILTSNLASESITTPQPWQIIEDVDEDDTFQGDDGLKSVPYQSLGFQLHPAVRVGDDTRHFVVLWFRYKNDSEPVKYDFAELDFDPSETWHTYRLDVMNEMDGVSVELFTDGKSLIFLSGIPMLSADAKFILSAWNRNAYVPSLEDVFNPPTTSAKFRGVRFPPLSNALCKFGEPFRNGDSAIKAFFAGIGSQKLLDDVVPFREIARPCLPCTNQCVSTVCDPECSNTDVKSYPVALRGLSLNTTRTVIEGGVHKSIPAVYHLTVKAVMGSGRYVLASSNGIYVDDTPPIFYYLYHVDVSWSLDQPITYQGSNTTIAVWWSAYDIGSQVHEYRWAVGSKPNTTDVQDFVSVGLDTFAANDNLLGILEDGKTYYVVVQAINRAGLVTSKVTTGVTLMLTPPDLTASNATSVCDDDDTNTDVDDVSLCGSQSSTGMTWTRVEDDSVDSYLFSIGSSPGAEDIFSRIQVGYNTSGAVEIKDGIVYIGDEPIVNVSGVREPTEDVEITENRFHMEPGRTMFSKITVCNKAHKCNDMSTSVITIARNGDSLSSHVNGSGVEISLPTEESAVSIQTELKAHKTSRKRDVDSDEDDQPTEVTLMAGVLSNDDLQDQYASDASHDFKPFIVNPDLTKDETDRDLRSRIKDIIGPSFYLTTIGREPMSAPLNITLGVNVSHQHGNEHERELKLIFWQTEMEEWQDSCHTCAEYSDTCANDIGKGILSVQVCSTENQHLEESSKFRRSASTNAYFSGPTLFTLASIGPFVNTPPLFTSATAVWMWEDAGTLRFQVTAYDDEDDDVKFTLEGNIAEENFGEISVSSTGELHYKPCLDCFGLKSVRILATEYRTDDREPLSTPKTLTIDVHGVNDNPDIFLVTDPLDVADGMIEAQVITTEERKGDDGSFKAVVGAFDPDTMDILTLLFDPPQHGTLQIGKQHTDVDFINDDCLPLSNVTDEYLSHNNSDESTVLYPCGLLIPHSADRLAWVFSSLAYVPDKDFHGEDSFKLNAIDRSGAHSEVINLKVYVLANPCENGGVCNGTELDPDCTSEERSKGFDGYTCSCPPGFVGEYCHTDYNECESNPCPSNFTCVDQINSFACYCENLEWPCGGRFSPTVIIAAICSAVILALVVIIILRRAYLKKKKHLKVAPKNDDLSKAFDQTYSDADENLELTKEKSKDDSVNNNNNDDMSEDIGKVEETVVDDVEEIECSDPTKSPDHNDESVAGDAEQKIVLSVEQRFGFVDRPAAPTRAWGRAKSAKTTSKIKVTPVDDFHHKESQA